MFVAQILTELEQFEDKENLWNFCNENIYKIEHTVQTWIFHD